jgi:TM2 domain-containing membrane protein YozV
MGLIACPECKAQISDLSDKCVQCGYPLRPIQAEAVDKTRNVRDGGSLLAGNPHYDGGTRQHNPPPTRPVSQKSRGTFIILGVLLGGLGIHNFYAGYLGRGFVQLLTTVVLGVFFFVGIMIVGFWVIAELFMVKVDAAGRTMT